MEDVTPQPDPLHIKSPRAGKVLRIALMCLAFAALCVWMLLTAREPLHVIVGIAGIACFSGGGILLLFRLRHADEDMYVINAEGVHFADAAYPMIPWQEIEGVVAFSVQSQRYVGLRLRDEDAYVNALPRRQRYMAEASRKMGFPAVSLNMRDEAAQVQCVETCVAWWELSDC